MSPTQSTVLLVHADSHTRQTLEQAGFAVQCCDDSLTALNLIAEATTPAVNAVVISRDAAPLNGFQFCRLLKHDPATQIVPVIVDVRNSEGQVRHWAYQACADGVYRGETRLPDMLKSLLAVYERVQTSRKPISAYDVQKRRCNALDHVLLEANLMTDCRNLHDLVQNPSMLCHMLMSVIETVLDYSAIGCYFPGVLNQPDRLMLAPASDQPGLSPLTLQHLGQQCLDHLPSSQELTLSDIRLEPILPVNTQSPLIAYSHCRVFPVHRGQRFLGALAVWANHPLPDEHSFPLNTLLEEFSLLLHHTLSIMLVEQMTLTDSMTQVYHHSHLMESLNREIQRAQRYEQPLCLVKLNLDNFQTINQQYGFFVGDQLLTRVADILRTSFRQTDFIARYGADQFMVLMPNTSLIDAERASQRFLELAADQLFLPADEEKDLLHYRPTVSMGLTYWDERTESANDMIDTVNRLAAAARQQPGNCLLTHRVQLSRQGQEETASS